MSQCLFLKNKNGVILLSDSALTGFDDQETYKITNKHPKVFKGDNYIWCNAGIAIYEEDIQRELENTKRPITQRLNCIIENMKIARKIYNNSLYPFNYQLLVAEYDNEHINSYLLLMSEKSLNCYESSDDRPLIQPIGLYSEQLLNEIDKKDIDNLSLIELVKFGTQKIEECIKLDKIRNKGMFVDGEVFAISLDKDGNMCTYINNKEKDF